ncbi:unnamed protein product, partial [Linum tenue]
YKQTFPYPSPFISLHKQQSRLFPPPFPPLSHQPFLLPLSLQPCVSPIMALTKLTTKLLFVAILGLLAFTQVGHAQFFNGTVGGDGDGEGGDGGDYGEVAAGGGRGAPTKEALVPAMFIFGDSLIDNGNNNNLASLAKANYLPYGIDFNGGPTGRFSNGYTMVDEIDQLTGKLGAVETAQGIGRSIFFVGMGSNDYLNNYLMPNYPTRGQYNGQQYADLLVHQYTRQLNTLYNLGARKFVIAGLGVMGCIPSILAQSPAGLCSEEVNKLVTPFNQNVKAMINNFNANLPGARFTYIDIAKMFREVLTNSERYGFSVVNRGCCGIGRNAGQITCLPFQTPCNERGQYVFWDAFHPTEAVNVLMGRKAFNGDTTYVYPINIEQLARIG